MMCDYRRNLEILSAISTGVQSKLQVCTIEHGFSFRLGLRFIRTGSYRRSDNAREIKRLCSSAKHH
jgi:hypothetical protein